MSEAVSRVGAAPRRHRAGGEGPAWSLGGEISWAVSDSAVLARRNLLHLVRVREMWPFMILQPMVLVLLFSLVFGGAIPLPGGGSYREYLMGGVFAQAVAFATYPTALGMAFDLQLGLMDRLRTLPIHPAAIFLGRTVADLGRMAVSIAVMAACGLLVGWRVDDGLVRAIAGFALLGLFAYAMSWVGAYFGLVAKSIQAASSTPMIYLFPVTFLSSAFVPTQSMPQPLEAVAEWNPVSSMAASARELFGNPNPAGDSGAFPAQHPVLLAVVWSVAVTLIAAVACTRRMRAVAR